MAFRHTCVHFISSAIKRCVHGITCSRLNQHHFLSYYVCWLCLIGRTAVVPVIFQCYGDNLRFQCNVVSLLVCYNCISMFIILMCMSRPPWTSLSTDMGCHIWVMLRSPCHLLLINGSQKFICPIQPQLPCTSMSTDMGCHIWVMLRSPCHLLLSNG